MCAMLTELPNELIVHVFSFLPYKDLCNAKSTCKAFAKLAAEHPKKLARIPLSRVHFYQDKYSCAGKDYDRIHPKLDLQCMHIADTELLHFQALTLNERYIDRVSFELKKVDLYVKVLNLNNVKIECSEEKLTSFISLINPRQLKCWHMRSPLNVTTLPINTQWFKIFDDGALETRPIDSLLVFKMKKKTIMGIWEEWLSGLRDIQWFEIRCIEKISSEEFCRNAKKFRMSKRTEGKMIVTNTCNEERTLYICGQYIQVRSF